MTSPIETTARELAERIISNPMFRLTTAPAHPSWLALDRGMLTNSIKAALQFERDKALEEAARDFDQYKPGCIWDAKQIQWEIRALKSSAPQKMEREG